MRGRLLACLVWAGAGWLGVQVSSDSAALRAARPEEAGPVQAPSPRAGAAAVLLSDGRVLVAGGNAGEAVAGAQVYEPTNRGLWRAASDLTFGRAEHSLTVLAGGAVLALGGESDGKPTDTAELLTRWGWDLLPSPVGRPLAGHTATLLLDGRVLVLGGRDAEGTSLDAAMVIEPPLGQADRLRVLALAGRLAVPRYDHTATMLPDGRVLVVGGRSDSGELATAELLDPATGVGLPLKSHLAHARAEHTATLRADGSVLVLGGRSGDDVVSEAEVFDPTANQFRGDSLVVSRVAHTATLLPTGEILVSGGEGAERSAQLLPAVDKDEVAPRAMALLPGPGATEVPVDALIAIRFSEPIDVRSLTPGFELRRLDGQVIAAVVSAAEAGLYGFLVPEQGLEPATWYQVTASGVTDPAANRARRIVWRFRTRAIDGSATDLAGQPRPQAPSSCTVDVGPDRVGLLPARTRLVAVTVGGGGQPVWQWTQVSGPAPVTFTLPYEDQTDVIVTAPGTYVLRVTVHDQYCQPFSDDLQYTVGVRGDMNGDGRPDLMWQERAGLNMRVWTMGGANGLTRTAEITPTPATSPGVNQKIVAIGDFDGDGKSDWLVQRNAAGKIFVYYMDGVVAKPNMPVFVADTPNGDQNWMVVGAPDLNHDGKPDLLLQHQLDGTLQVWYLNGITVTSTGTINGLTDIGPNPKVVSVDDWNADGNADLLYQRPFTGKMFVAYLNGADYVSQVFLTPAFPSTDPNDQVNWRVVASGDYNGDAKPDLLLKHELTGVLKAWLMNGVSRDQEVSPTPDRFDPANPTASVEWWVYGNFAWYRGRLGTPVITPTAGTFTGPIDVTVAAWTGSAVPWAGATLRYTTNGADPDVLSPVYTGPLFLDQPLASLKAQASMLGWVTSAIAAAGPYTFTVANPVFNLASGQYPWGTRIAVTCATPGALIRYTTNGNEPTESDPTVASGATVVLDRAFTLKAKAWKLGSQASGTTTATYSLSDQNVRSVLMVVGDVNDPGDLSVRDHLISRGYTVIVKADDEVVRQDAGLASVVLFSASCDESDPDLAAFWDVTTSIVSLDPQLWDDFRMATPRAGMVAPTQVTITAPTHALAAHKQGTLAVYSAPVWNVIGDPGSAAVKVASYDTGGADPAVFAYERGAALLAGQWAMGRRVGIFDTRASMTGDGWDLFDAAIEWSVSRREARVVYIQGAPVNTGTVSPHDLVAIGRLNQLGFAVFIKDANATASDASGMAFVAISSSLGDVPATDDTTARFRSVAAPVVIWKNGHFDNLFGTMTRQTTDAQTTLNVVLPGHPLAAGLAAGSVQVTNYPKRFGWAGPPSTAVSVAAIPSTGNFAVFGFEFGALLPGTQSNPNPIPAPERRVGLFMDDPSVFSSLTTNGWKLFDAAVRWASESDSDHDGLTSAQESAWRTDPRNPDTNDDGILDGAAVAAGISPTNRDMDGDGVDNLVERQRGTDPFRWDTDGDGCSDNSQVPGGDWFPLDPSRCQVGDTPGVPSITLVEPTNATCVNTTCSPSPCP